MVEDKARKGRSGSQTGQTFLRLSEEISIAVKLGGGNPASKPMLCALVSDSEEVHSKLKAA